METASETLAVESDWLPASELHRLLEEFEGEFPELSVEPEESPEHRGLDPTIAVALVNGAVTLLAPLVTKLVERIFKAQPKAKVALSDANGVDQVTLLSSLPEETRTQIVNDAIASGALRVRISLEPAK